MSKYSLVFFAVVFTHVNFLSAQSADVIRWYRSNSSGMTVEYTPSRLAAMRNEYCLSVERANPVLIPDIINSYYNEELTAELRVLYEKGKAIRRQWVFRDSNGMTRLSSSGNSGFFGLEKAGGEESGEEENISGFIEIRGDEGYITREFRFDEDRSEWEFRYSYNNGALVSAETWFRDSSMSQSGDNPEAVFVLLCTDYYRYSRPGSMRVIERVLNKETESTENKTRLPFPRLGTGVSQAEEIVIPRISYVPEFISGVYQEAGERVDYTIDSRGRILTEVWKDEEGELAGEIINTWDGDRLVSILWKSHDQVLLVEYEYDSEGNRIMERNFKQGVLERSVTGRGSRDIEEIYMNGKVILRAVWENGLKISEERVPAAGGTR